MRRPVAAVIGGGDATGAELADAEALGRALVGAGFRVLTGGLGGVMAAASREGISSPRDAEIGVRDGAARRVTSLWGSS